MKKKKKKTSCDKWKPNPGVNVDRRKLSVYCHISVLMQHCESGVTAACHRKTVTYVFHKIKLKYAKEICVRSKACPKMQEKTVRVVSYS